MREVDFVFMIVVFLLPILCLMLLGVIALCLINIAKSLRIIAESVSPTLLPDQVNQQNDRQEDQDAQLINKHLEQFNPDPG